MPLTKICSLVPSVPWNTLALSREASLRLVGLSQKFVSDSRTHCDGYIVTLPWFHTSVRVSVTPRLCEQDRDYSISSVLLSSDERMIPIDFQGWGQRSQLSNMKIIL